VTQWLRSVQLQSYAVIRYADALLSGYDPLLCLVIVMFRYVVAVIGVLLGVFVYYAFIPTKTSFAIQHTIYQNLSDVFYFVRNPYMLLDTCYSV